MTPFQMLNQKPAGFQANGQTGNAFHTGLGGGGGMGGPSTGGLAPGSPIAQWMQQQGLNPTFRDPSQDPQLAQAWNQLPAMQQLSMLNSAQGGTGLYDSLIAGGNNQAAMGNFLTNTNRSAGYGLSDVNTRGNIGTPIQAYGGQQGGFTQNPGFGMNGAQGSSPAGPASNPAATLDQPGGMPATLGSMAGSGATSGMAGGGTPGGTMNPAGSGAGGLGTIPLPSSSNGYGLNVAAYQNPMAQTMQDWANKALQSTYAGAGDLLSGPAMQGITQFNQQAALNNSYAPALAAAEQQQGTGIGLDQYNQQFAYNQALNNQTIPFSQQMQLANLGLQGAQGQQGVTNLNAQLQAMLAQSLGQAQGAGTQGAAGALTGGANSGLSNYLQQYLLQQIMASNPNYLAAQNANPTG